MITEMDEDLDGQVNLHEWRAGLKKEYLQAMSKQLDDRGLLADFIDDGRYRKKPAIDFSDDSCLDAE